MLVSFRRCFIHLKNRHDLFVPTTTFPTQSRYFKIMAARKSAVKAEADVTPRRSTRAAATKTEDDSTPVKQERTSSASRKANVGVKRAASSPTRAKTSKRVKTEVKNEDDDDDAKPIVDSVEDALKDESDSELSAELSEVESDFSDDVDTKKKKSSSKSRKKGNASAKTTPAKKTKSAKATPKSESKTETNTSPGDKEAALQAKKLKSYAQFSKTSPFPDFPHPTPEEAKLGHKILASLHGERIRPEKVVARNDVAGCGDSPSVLDALVRTILSQNTSDKNSTRAKLSMNKVYGGSDEWALIHEGGLEKLQAAIKCGGLAGVKSKVIMSILDQVKERYGEYSLDHMFEKTDEEAMSELIGYKGVGPKTASCVLLFCLQRESFAVDTHVYRIAGLLGWRPKSATRDQTHAHLEVRIPDEDKYGLHILMVGHGKKCEECKAGGKSVGKCELRKAFRQGKLKGEAGEDLKEEEEEVVKEEEGEDGDEDDKENVKEEEWESGQEDYVHGMQGGKSKGKGGDKKKTKGRK